ncbi:MULTISPECIES: serine hydrolase domain-containing protein [Paenibacillus]|uniref:CubicO group peptidase (Beta-lactamase class C family) n=1 Tax=Paenibacillus pabuli TaxID=1472 RepID=A0A855XZR8_9BACL|nr:MULTISPECIES: serine hydrolase domain-containing protein [Paenibacillus]PWW33509.1 CubicO group peptidase (beta-lactamase class C family) [Paenibacillus pabuli]PXV99772.1 CubicO group peptidase (beta-lactamase class C family) [Paenibacillus taichungensis]
MIQQEKMKVLKRTVKKRTSIAALTLALTMLAPLSAMAAPAAMNNSINLTYETTKKTVIEKAKLLTETYGTTSLQYALIDGGEITVSGQMGKNDLNDKVPLTSNTIYGIGSTSKMMLTAVVMKLVDEGKIDLDVPVVNYMPDFTMKDKRYKQITPRMLLNHSAGLPGTSSGSAILYGDNDTYAHDTFLDQLATQNLMAEPGAFSVYSNDGFTLAEILVERVTGTSFTAFIHKYFTEPLKMNHTKTPQDIVNTGEMAGIYSPVYKGQLPQENYNIIASGGIYSTAKDLVKFSQIFTGEVKGILSKKSVEAMEQKEYRRGMWPEDSDTSMSYGLGWDSVDLFPFSDYGIKAVTKGGDTLSYHSSLVVLPEYNMAAAVISSGGSSVTDQFIASELLLSALEEKGIIKERKAEKSFGVPVKAEMPKEISKFAGRYGGNNSVTKIQINKAGQMTVSSLTAPSHPVQEYTYTSDGTFVSDDGTEKLKFVVEGNGNTYLWSRSYISVPGLGQVALSEYNAEKLEANTLPKEINAAWAKRDGKKYYLVNAKYTSMFYLNATSIVPIYMNKENPGYMSNNKIIGADEAANQLQIPGSAGREPMDIHFFKKNDGEYLTFSGYVFVSEELVKPIYSGKQSATTIQADGYAKWFSVPATAKGKVMTVKLPANGAFAIYDQNGICINHSVVSGKNVVVLPENGRIVFAGEAGSQFQISLKK